MSSGNFLRTFRHNLSVPSSGVKIGPIGCPASSERNYHYSLLNNPEYRISHLRRGGSLKARVTLCLPFSVSGIVCGFFKVFREIRFKISVVNYYRWFWYVILLPPLSLLCGSGSSVGIATDCGLDGPGSNPGGGRDFPPVQTGPGAHPASCTMGTVSFRGCKLRPGRTADHSSPSSAAVMEE